MTGTEAIEMLKQGKNMRRFAWCRWHIDYIFWLKPEGSHAGMIVNVPFNPDPDNPWAKADIGAWQFFADDWEEVPVAELYDKEDEVIE